MLAKQVSSVAPGGHPSSLAPSSSHSPSIIKKPETVTIKILKLRLGFSNRQHKHVLVRVEYYLMSTSFPDHFS
jgi:hypothetical protein